MNKKLANLKVIGIHCNGCATKIKDSLDSLKTGVEANVDITTGNVSVSFDGDITKLSDIKSKIISAGFQVEKVELE